MNTLTETTMVEKSTPANGSYVSDKGIRVTMVNGQPMLNADDMYLAICQQVEKLTKHANPLVEQAKGARQIIAELLTGIGAEMDEFKASTKLHLEYIRQTRFSVVQEAAKMTKELADVRQFFLGDDYEKQKARLSEFIDICERLKTLKDSGFLDSVADTMLKLA